MKTKLFLLFPVFALVCLTQTLSAQTVAKVEKKLRDITIEHLEVEDATPRAVINLLRIEAKRLDPNKKGVNIVTFLETPKKKKARLKKKREKEKEEDFLLDEEDEKKVVKEKKEGKTITLMLDDISLYDAIKNICMAADLKYRIEEYAVVIAHKNYPMAPVKTKIYPVDPEVFNALRRRLGK